MASQLTGSRWQQADYGREGDQKFYDSRHSIVLNRANYLANATFSIPK